MKLTLLSGSLLIAGLSAIGFASISLESMPSRIYTGDIHELSWTTDRDYDMELLLVKHYYLPAGSGLDPIQTIFQNRTVAKGSGTCNWTVPNVKYGGSYSLWLNGNESLGVGYANLTNKFWIESPANSNPLLLSPGQIVGVVAGSLAAILMGASAIVIMLRVTRNKREARRLEGEEAHVRDSFDSDFDEKAFDSVLDEKAKAAVPMGDDRH